MSKNKKGKHKKNYSTIEHHARQGKLLIPPFMQIPSIKFNSWVNDRLPEMIWAVLLVTHLTREQALEVFRRIINYWYEQPEKLRPKDLTMSDLGEIKTEELEKFLKFLFHDEFVQGVLKSLILFKDLPGKEQWENAINDEPRVELWTMLAEAVAKALDHQSQEATDCRWVRVCYQVVIGRMYLPTEELFNEIIKYPNYGEMTKVRPSIRASEMGLNITQDEKNITWPQNFWDQCLHDTPCRDWFAGETSIEVSVDTTKERVSETTQKLVEHCFLTQSKSSVDAKHDAVFGIALYCLSIVEELLFFGNSRSTLGRMGLRSIVECYITLAYLCAKDDSELWLTYRNYGTGQAKLSFLKLDQMETPPGFVNVETLQALAGEDLWQEFVQINLGHWENSNLRVMSENAGVKADYDAFYSWTSGYIHGQWGAVRDTVFQTCSNPLHRLHRIPKIQRNELNDVLPDAVQLVDKIIGCVNKMYPNFEFKVSVE